MRRRYQLRQRTRPVLPSEFLLARFGGEAEISDPFGKHLVASGVVKLTTPKFLGDRLRFEPRTRWQKATPVQPSQF